MTLSEFILLLGTLLVGLLLALVIAVGLLLWLAGSPVWLRRLDSRRRSGRSGVHHLTQEPTH